MSGNSNAGPTIRDRVETNRTVPIRVPNIPGCEMRLTARETHGWNAARPTAWTARRLSTCHSSAQKGSKTQGKVKPNAPTIIMKRGPRRSDIGPNAKRKITAATINKLVWAEAINADPPSSITYDGTAEVSTLLNA